MKSAKDTSYYEYVTFLENDTTYRICDKQRITRNNKKYYVYSVYELDEDSNSFIFSREILVNALKAQIRSCKAIYDAIRDEEHLEYQKKVDEEASCFCC